jgi:integrase
MGNGQHTISIAQILALGDDVRVQNPDVLKTAGEKPRWYIRPYVDVFNPETGAIESKQERVYLGSCDEISKREAIRKKNEIMQTINRRQYVVQAQIPFGDFLDVYLKEYVKKPENLSASTQSKYTFHIKNHIRPAFASMCMAEITTKSIDSFLTAKSSLSWATRTDLKNILCGIFTQAERWGYWKERNPARLATVGRKREVRQKQKLTDEQTRQILAALPFDVRMIVMVALFCGCRISEVLGLQWKHVDFTRGVLMIRQRFYRGDLDVAKSQKSIRDLPLGYLAEDLKLMQGNPEDFVFTVQTHVGNWNKPGQCRDDRDINQHFLRPAAVQLGLYYKGFGFHAFRREAVTEWMSHNPGEAMNAAGHATADISRQYTMNDLVKREQMIRRHQERLIGASGKSVN